MGKLNSILSAIVLTLSAMLFTSCDEDVYVGSTLQGTWSGNLYAYSEWNGRMYRASYSEIEFDGDPFRVESGTGTWVDHYAGDAPWRYYVDHFSWRVNRGVINIRFWSDGFETYISDYRLNNNYFEGYIYLGSNSGEEYFELRKLSDATSWSGYEDGYYYWDDYYYVRGTRAEKAADVDSTTTMLRPTHRLGK